MQQTRATARQGFEALLVAVFADIDAVVGVVEDGAYGLNLLECACQIGYTAAGAVAKQLTDVVIACGSRLGGTEGLTAAGNIVAGEVVLQSAIENGILYAYARVRTTRVKT